MRVTKHIVDPDGDCVLHLRPQSLGSSPHSDIKSVNAVNKLDDIQFLISSKQMAIASPVFKAMFDMNKFREGQQLAATGMVEIHLPDDQPDAFAILVSKIHGVSNASPPQKLNLEILYSIAVLADKYELRLSTFDCKEWLESFLHDDPMWNMNPTKFRSAFSRQRQFDQALMWLTVSWIMDYDIQFWKTMCTLIREADDDIYSIIDESGLDVPVPQKVIDTINKIRFDLIGHAAMSLRRIFKIHRKCGRKFPEQPHSKIVSSHPEILAQELEHAYNIQRFCDFKAYGPLGGWTEKDYIPLGAPYTGFRFEQIRRDFMHKDPCEFFEQEYLHCPRFEKDSLWPIRWSGIGTVLTWSIEGLRLEDFKKVSN